MIRGFLPGVAALFGLMAATGPASAQFENFLDEIPQNLRQPTRIHTGNEVAFCVNDTSMMAPFERALAQKIGDALLLETSIVSVTPVIATDAYDFRLPLQDFEIYLYLAHHCDAFMGFTVGDDYPGWQSLSMVYLSTQTVLATRTPYRSMAELPRSATIGGRLLSLAGGTLLSYLHTLPESSRWKQALFASHASVLGHLADGSVEAILIWEPAVARYRADHPDMPPVYVVRELAFPVPKTDFVLALWAQNDFLNQQLSQAVATLIADGTIDRLAHEHHLFVEEP